MVTGNLPVLHWICDGQLDENTMRFHYNASPPHPSHLSLSACCVHILTGMKDCCFISVVELCDDGFALNFDSKNLFLRKGNGFLIGYMYATTDLYLIEFNKPQPLPSVSNHAVLPPSTSSPIPFNILANSVHVISTKRDLVLYLHQAAWRPVQSTRIQ